MFKDDVKQISESFIAEALKSPSLLEDMAAMEMYMAESYSSRTFIELLQNADDALSTRIFVSLHDGNIFFANNGKPFDSNDLVSICRSGASTKERGKNIGYRGIGFKSATYISNEITIYSNEVYFSFSKSLCSKLLNKQESKIPTVRIPLLIEEVDVDVNIKNKINNIRSLGYSTVFVFKKANMNFFKNELSEISKGLFLFLNNICECNINVGASNTLYRVERFNIQRNKHVILSDNNITEEWMLVNSKKVSIAFKVTNGVIVPCDDEEAIYHCYLPTIDKVNFPFKVNADFTTDPSRKHITFDERTEEAITEAALLMFDIVDSAINECDSDKFRNIMIILGKSLSFSKINLLLENKFKKLLETKRWLKLNNGDKISIKDYKRIIGDYTDADKAIFRKQSQMVQQHSLPSIAYDNIDQLDAFLNKHSEAAFTNDEIISIAEDDLLVTTVNPETIGRLVTNIIKESKDNSIFSNDTANLEQIRLQTKENGFAPIEKIKKHNLELADEVKKVLNDQLTISEIDWFKRQTGITDAILPPKERYKPFIEESKQDSKESIITSKTIKPYVSKWRDAEQKCIEIEAILGNSATDVSIRNEGYDILSVTPKGEKRYIEVKSVKSDWEFSLTNNEYTSASQYENNYYLCLLCENGDKLQVRYIQNPLQKAKFEKRIRQWEWVCTNFEYNEIEFAVK